MLKENVIDNWGEALKNIALETNAVDEFLEQANTIINLLKEKSDFVKILSVQNLEFKKTKIKIIDSVFAETGVNPYLVNALKILVEEQNFYYARTILKKMRKKLTSLRNILYGVAWSTNQLTHKQMEAMEKKMSKHFQREVRLVNKLDPNLLGGVQLVVHGHIFDGSVKGKLDQLRYETLNGK